ncbi:MAG: YhdH/YhfP family quinone oxidoreductase [Proteocatella sp.]
MTANYKAMIVSETDKGEFSRDIVTRYISSLPSGEVLINVKYSSLNYKDALSATGNRGVTKKYPHTPGIDAAGIVIESTNVKFRAGDQVFVTGYDLGMNTSGGFSQYIRVPGEWIVKLPKGLSLKESMIFGTAGFTAALSVSKLINCGISPNDGDILVTGATGGVGSVAVSILNKLGYQIIAATGKPQSKDMLLKLGAKDIILRDELDDKSDKSLLKGRWAGVIDTVGGNILATALKSTQYGGCVTCCGNVASHELSTTVYPFILRGVSLSGVDSVQCPMDLRIQIWDKLSEAWKPDNLHENVEEINLNELDKKINQILSGKLKGRTVINLDM